MTSIQLIIMISLAHLAAVISPGPDFVMVVKNALSYSRKIGVYTAIGIGSGIIVHVSYTFFGLGYFIQENTIFFKVIQYLGAAYLFYMGFTALFSSSSKHQLVKDAQTIKNISASKAFQIGFLTNVLNPKAALFFFGFVYSINF